MFNLEFSAMLQHAGHSMFGMSPATGKLMASVFNPCTRSGLKNCAIVALRQILQIYPFEVPPSTISDVTDAPKAALMARDDKDYEGKVYRSLTYPLANLGLHAIHRALTLKLDNAIDNMIPDKLFEEVFAQDGNINIFLHKIVLAKDKENAEENKTLLKDCLHGDVRSTLNSMTRNTIGMPGLLIRLYAECRILINASKTLAPYIRFPLDREHKLLKAEHKLLVAILLGGVMSSLSVNKQKKQNISIKERSENSIKETVSWLEYATETPISIVARSCNSLVVQKIKEHYAGSFPNELSLKQLNVKTAAIYSMVKGFFFYLLPGRAMLRAPNLTYIDDLLPIKSAMNNLHFIVSQILNTEITSTRHRINKLNRLTEAIEAAKAEYKEAQNHLQINDKEINDKVVLEVLASEDKPFVLSFDKLNPVFTITTNLILEKGDIMLLQGETGSGKSSFSNAILGGAYIREGIVKRTGSFHTAMLDHTTMPSLSRLQDIIGKEKISESEIDQVISLFIRLKLFDIEGLDRVEQIAKINGRNTADISGGENRRIALITSLISGKDLILLDETLANLDAPILQIVMKLIKEQAELGKTFIIIDHLPENTQNRPVNGLGNLYNKTCIINKESKTCDVRKFEASNSLSM